MTWTKEAMASSLAPVVKTCTESGGRYQVPRVAAPRSHRCPECQEEYEVERKKEIRVKRGHIREYEPKVSYRLVYDPDGSWGRGTCLAAMEMRELLKRSYLTVGTVFEVSGVRQKVVKDPHGGQKLVEMASQDIGG